MLRSFVLFCLALAAFPVSAAAEWHFTPMLGVTFGGSTTLVDPDVASGNPHPSIGFAGTWLSKGIFGAEGIGAITPRFFQTDPAKLIHSSRSTAVMGNVVVTAPKKFTEYFLRPFASGGFGVIRATEQAVTTLGSSPIGFEVNLPGFNIGGGAIGFLSQSVGVKFDVRYYGTVHGTDQGANAFGPAHLRYTTASIGLVIRR